MAKAEKKLLAENEDDFTRVNMNLTKQDVDNLDFLTERLNCRRNVNAISRALQMATDLCNLIDTKDAILAENKDGKLTELRFFV